MLLITLYLSSSLFIDILLLCVKLHMYILSLLLNPLGIALNYIYSSGPAVLLHCEISTLGNLLAIMARHCAVALYALTTGTSIIMISES